ncbi:MAG: hypothetical protein KTR20_14800 [Cellvibrionaceae bacterium]|nr:hypothetical protein [Cellvibrionaceae bacterium]
MSNEERLNIWRALSDLFLDAEVEDLTFVSIARTISESSFSLSEVEGILWYEVYPVLEANLRSVAGVWDGWPDTWLLQNLPAPMRPEVIGGKPAIIKEIKDCWKKVVAVYESNHG